MHTLTKADGDNPLFGVNDVTGAVEGEVTDLHLGLAWEAVAAPQGDSGLGKAKKWLAKKQREAQGTTDPADLDAGALFFVGDKPTKYLGFDNFEPFKDEADPNTRQSAAHSGDSVTGEGDGDDEVIRLNLRRIPSRFTKILLVVGAFKKGSSMRAVRDVKATVYDATGGSADPVAEIEPSLLEDKMILAIATLKRVDNGRWTLAVEDASFDITQGDIRSLLRNSLHVFQG
jgi:stress response protein SCP2